MSSLPELQLLKKIAGHLGCLIFSAMLLVLPVHAADSLSSADICERCHDQISRELQGGDAPHNFACRDCHATFHKPKEQELMPRCLDCHDALHGESFVKCGSCHSNGHAPQKFSSLDILTPHCHGCHGVEAREARDRESRHYGKLCESCHNGGHGHLPACTDCHQPHPSRQVPTDCGTCHGAHHPTRMIFSPDMPSESCQSCHRGPYLRWSHSPAGHGAFSCSVCHVRHRLLPACTDCHIPPHDEEMLKGFKHCLGCHLDPHDLKGKGSDV